MAPGAKVVFKVLISSGVKTISIAVIFSGKRDLRLMLTSGITFSPCAFNPGDRNLWWRIAFILC